MKKRLFLGVLGLLVLFALTPAVSMGATAGACVETVQDIVPITKPNETINVKQVTLTCIGASADGTFPAITIAETTQNLKSWYLYKMITDHGTKEPQDLWDVTITDENSIDILGGVGADRSHDTAQSVYPKNNGLAFAQPVLGTWQINISGNNETSADIVVKLIFVR
jgi:hypothetical protein